MAGSAQDTGANPSQGANVGCRLLWVGIRKGVARGLPLPTGPTRPQPRFPGPGPTGQNMLCASGPSLLFVVRKGQKTGLPQGQGNLCLVLPHKHFFKKTQKQCDCFSLGETITFTGQDLYAVLGSWLPGAHLPESSSPKKGCRPHPSSVCVCVLGTQ